MVYDLLTGPLKDWVPALIAGVFALTGIWVSTRSKRGAELRGRMAERERAEKQEATAMREAELSSTVSQSQDLTQRFRTLMEGYENRIKDMTTELAVMKGEQRALDKLYDDHRNICNTCPHYSTLRSQHASPPA
jgi:hypothetical protein